MYFFFILFHVELTNRAKIIMLHMHKKVGQLVTVRRKASYGNGSVTFCPHKPQKETGQLSL